MAEPAAQHINIALPNPPPVLEEIKAAKNDINAIGGVISHHKELAKEVLDTINAPFFALVREIKSVEEAVRMLGMTRIFNLTTGRLLRTTVFSDKDRQQLELWKTSSKIAVIAVLVSKEQDLGSTDEAYAMAAFQNVGMAILASHTPDYWSLVKQSYFEEDNHISQTEIMALGMSHAQLSGELAQLWGLSLPIAQAIRLHHSPDQIIHQLGKKNDVSDLLVVLKISEHIGRLPGYLAKCPQDFEWEIIKEACFDYLKITEGMFRRFDNNIKKNLAEIKY